MEGVISGATKSADGNVELLIDTGSADAVKQTVSLADAKKFPIGCKVKFGLRRVRTARDPNAPAKPRKKKDAAPAAAPAGKKS